MIPSCCPWKVVTFFGKEHVNWSSINGDMIGKSWTIKSIIVLIPPIFSFSNLIIHLLPILTPPKLDQLTWSLPKNVTTFHREQDWIIQGVFWQFEWNWAIEFGNVHYFFGKNMNSKCQNTPFIGTETKMIDSILLPVKISYIFW